MSNDPDLILRTEECRDCQGRGEFPLPGRQPVYDWDYETCLTCWGAKVIEVQRGPR